MVLGLLTALEADPQHAATSLHAAQAKGAGALDFGVSAEQAPVEMDAVLASITRIAERLAKAESGAGRHSANDAHNNGARSPVESPVPFNHEAVSRLIGLQPSASPSQPQPIATDSLSPSFVSKQAEVSPVASFGTESSDGAPNRPSAEQELKQLKAQIKDFARVCKAVARGDLSQKVEVNVQGEDLRELKEDINGMVEKLTTFANEGELSLA
jgi:osomolarity two-component system sensor histidine kinase NIK1